MTIDASRGPIESAIAAKRVVRRFSDRPIDDGVADRAAATAAHAARAGLVTTRPDGR